ncbi:MAG: preprotein translocase subunit SecG [Sphingobacteriia bacterium]|jgi:preprotein translocase subunit SecG|nr:MAG: preprotein translocase subunit SecG [Sphingobacteriia bacterium]TAG31193.1 MAG: preprotein translocase subunit SecG [Sphingobacteriia bacterium]TAH07464.1 MAG: preprotein translocase subunit SecG [Sphingobacteriia bacterium]
MIYLFLVLIVIAAVGLGFMVLIQNPKGGGLAGNVGGIGNQLMGVKQTTDVLEKGTWIFAGIIAVLALFSTLFLKGGSNEVDNSILQKINTNTSTPAPIQQAPANTVTIPADSLKK